MLVSLISTVSGRFVRSECILLANRLTASQWETFEFVQMGGNRVAVRCAGNGKFVCAESGGSLPLAANRDAAQAWETFEKVDTGNNRFALKSLANGMYVCAENAGALPLIANRTTAAEWEMFEKVSMGNDRFAIKSMSNGKMLSAERTLIANQDQAAEWETFEQVSLGNSRVAFKCLSNGKYVCAENAGTLPLVVNRDLAAEWETFEQVDLGSNRFALRSFVNKKFVCAEREGTAQLIANRDVAADWENFQAVPHFPVEHGFKFVNTFKNDFIPALDVRTVGLCGGMSYAVLDYYFANMPVPLQAFTPANKTDLHSYLYDRQVASIQNNLDKWGEVGFNPGGARNGEFFNWGLSAAPGGRIDELKSFLDKGTPCVVALHGDGSTGNHQVVAIGYSMGRYKGDLGLHKEEFKIFIYDPNKPNTIRTLVPDVANQVYCLQDDRLAKRWRTYFVDKNYRAQTPPHIRGALYPNNGLVYELILEFVTGGDDLRSGNDNVDLMVNLADGSQQTYRNINRGARWIVDCPESAQVVLQRPIREEDLRSLVISTNFGGSIGGDNWDMESLNIYGLGCGFYRAIKTQIGPKRFTGEDKVLLVPIHDATVLPGQAGKLIFTFRTGKDDLRGGNDNIDLTIQFRNSLAQRVVNANGGRRWADNTMNEVTVDLNSPAAPQDIVSISIAATFKGGASGDNWNMDSLSVRAVGNNLDKVLASHGFKRFTGSDRTLTIPVTTPGAGQASKLQLTIKTGTDDLRGGRDNLDVKLRYRDGRGQVVNNVNGGARWANKTTNVVHINLDQPVPPADIIEITLQTTFSGGMGGDNWNMDSLQASAIGDSVNKVVFSHGYKRFTGSDKTLTLRQT